MDFPPPSAPERGTPSAHSQTGSHAECPFQSLDPFDALFSRLLLYSINTLCLYSEENLPGQMGNPTSKQMRDFRLRQLNTHYPWKAWPECCAVAFVLGLILLEFLRSIPLEGDSLSALRNLRYELVTLTSDHVSRNLFITFLFLYHLWLLWIKLTGRKNDVAVPEKGRKIDVQDVCRHVLALFSIVHFGFDWNAVPADGARDPLDGQCNYAIVFLAGIVISQALEILLSRQLRGGLPVGGISIALLVLLLCVASLSGSNYSGGYKYRAEIRETGLWDNPNTYGLLLGIGIVLAIALFMQLTEWIRYRRHGFFPKGVSIHFISRLRVNQNLLASVAFGCAGIAVVLQLVVGLTNSYSRGAWLATLAGMAYYCYHYPWKINPLELGTKVSLWFCRRCWLKASLFCAFTFLVLYRLSHSEFTVVKRLVSVTDVNDYSWRNRLLAWEGAMQIIADHPFFGVGWRRLAEEFEYFYAPSRLSEFASIQLNDFLTIGMAFGILGLACFLGLVYRAFWSIRTHDNWVTLASRSALVVSLVGFWFDGGLFKLSLAAPFWLLLELAALALPKGGPGNEIKTTPCGLHELSKDNRY